LIIVNNFKCDHLIFELNIYFNVSRADIIDVDWKQASFIALDCIRIVVHGNLFHRMALSEGVEPPTNWFRSSCSTAELREDVVLEDGIKPPTRKSAAAYSSSITETYSRLGDHLIQVKTFKGK